MSTAPQFWHRLPLPIARLALRSRNAKAPRDRHDAAYYALELSVRLTVAAHPPSDPGVLRRASLGTWIACIDPPERSLEQSELLELYRLLKREGSGQPHHSQSVRPRELLGSLAAYRNKVVGHGSSREPAYYDDAADVLMVGLDATWASELFLPRRARLVWVESAEVDAEGRRMARILDLTGSEARVIDPIGTCIPAGVLPRRLYLEVDGAFTPLHPWLLYQEGSEREREALYCFNGIGRVASYLDFASGEILHGSALDEAFPGFAADVERLFARVSVPEAPEPDVVEDGAAFGDYTILGKLGEGGMGVVYLARQRSLGRLVALKMLHTERARDRAAVARFRREIEALSRCEHPNVVKILASGTSVGTWYYAMELVGGVDLARVAAKLASHRDLQSAVRSAWEVLCEEHRDLSEHLIGLCSTGNTRVERSGSLRLLAHLFRDLARAVHHLHENGVIHRDLKPGNLMVTPGELRVVVMDLGLAALDTASLALSGTSGQLLGTLRYIPPEQVLRNRAGVDRRSDIYSLGTTFYELLCRRPFLDSDSEPNLLHQLLHGQPVPPEKANPEIPRDLALIVSKATEREATLRYETAAALADDLQAFLDGEPISARPPSAGYLLRLWVRRNRKLAATIAGAFAAILALTVFYILRLEESLESEEQARREYTELADITGAAGLVREVEFLYPVEPDLVERMQRWLARQDDLLSRREYFARELSEGRHEGERLRELEETVQNMGTLVELRPEVERRLADATSIEKRTLEHTAWDAKVLPDVASSEEYTSLDRPPQPQLGLVPLQRNPISGLWEFWHVNSGERPRIEDLTTGELDMRPESGIVLVLLPGGEFRMGTPREECPLPSASYDEFVHRRVVEPFFMSKYETTQGQWMRIFAANPSTHCKRGTERVSNSVVTYGPLHPVENVCWEDSVQFGRRLGLRLPSEPEWEYACRAGSEDLYCFGSNHSDLEYYANILSEEYPHPADDKAPWPDGYPRHAPIGEFLPNRFGLYDLHGNLAEWCADWYTRDLAAAASGSEPPGNSMPWLKILRGGDWGRGLDGEFWFRCGARMSERPLFRNQCIGFRMARSLDSGD